MAEATKRIKKFLFLDACMPSLEDCREDKSCKDNDGVLCVHRFKNDTEIVHTDLYIDFLRYYDFQIILHFLYLIVKYKLKGKLARRCEFYIITKDFKFEKHAKSGFLKSAQSEWERRRKNQSIKFKFDSSQVTAVFDLRGRQRTITIDIIEIPTKNYSTERTLKELVSRFNLVPPSL